MKCKQLETLLSEYLDGELPAPQAERVRQHLAECPRCAERWNGLRRTVRLVGHLGRETCPVDLRAGVLAAVGEAPPATRRSAVPMGHLWRRSGWSAAAAVVAAGVAVAVLHGGAPRPTALLHPALPLGSPAPSRLHDQFSLATSLGTTDGLLLAMPARSLSHPTRTLLRAGRR
jgi:anti-sigma factor RsiW